MAKKKVKIRCDYCDDNKKKEVDVEENKYPAHIELDEWWGKRFIDEPTGIKFYVCPKCLKKVFDTILGGGG